MSKRHKFRTIHASVFLACSLIITAFAADPKPFDAPAGDLTIAIDAIAKQSGADIVYQPSQLKGLQTGGVKGTLTVQEAVAKALDGTPLMVQTDQTGAMLITSRASNLPGGTPASPNATAANTPQHFNIRSEDLSQALQDFGAQSSITVTASPTLIATKNSHAVSGTMKASDALRRLLKGSGLTFVIGTDGGFVLQAIESEAPGQQKPDTADVTVEGQQQKEKPYSGMNVDIPRTIDDVQPYYIFDSETIDQSGATNIEDFLKQRLTMDTTYQTASQVYGVNNGGPANTTSSVNLRGLGNNETLILVDGHRMAGVAILGATGQPDLNGIPLAAIDRIEVLPSSASGIYGASALGGVINIILKRNYQGGEVRMSYDKPEHSSASTPSVDGNYGFSLEGGKTHVMLAAHYSDAEPLLIGDRTAVIQRGINTVIANCGVSCLGGGQVWPGGATPNILARDANANIQNLILGNGTVFSSPYAHIKPGCTASDPLISCLVPGQSYTLSPGYGAYGLAQPAGSFARVTSFTASANREMSSWLNVFTNIQVEDNLARSEYAPFANPPQICVPCGGYQAYVPGKSPFQNAFISFNVPSVESEPAVGDSTTRTVTVGGIATLPRGWRGEADYTWSKNEFRQQYYNFDSNTFINDLQSGAIDPFVDVLAYPPNFSRYLLAQTSDSSSTLNDLALRSSGPVGHLPWGDPTLAGAIEIARQAIPESTQYQPEAISNDGQAPGQNFVGAIIPTIYFPQNQTTESAYLEATVPLFTEKNAVWGVRSLEVQLADRLDRTSVLAGTGQETIFDYVTPPAILYGPRPLNAGLCPPALGFGSYLACGGTPSRTETTYQSNSRTLGLKYKPVEDIVARVSFATAFLPPAYYQLLPNPRVNIGGDTITDPKTGQTYQVNTISGGNPGLAPQTSRSWDVGLIFEPHDGALKGLRLDLEYYRISQFNYIVGPNGNELLSSPAFAGRILRNPAGIITLINESDINAPVFKTEGLDLSAEYRAITSIGTFGFRLAATKIQEEDRQLAIGGPMNDYAGWPGDGGEGRYKANGSIIWSNNGWMLGWTTTWFGPYHVIETAGDPTGNVNTGPGSPFQVQGSDHVPSQRYHQVLVGYSFGNDRAEWGGALANMRIQLVIKNVFNSLPPFDAAQAPFYYSPYGDLNLRTFDLSLRKSF